MTPDAVPGSPLSAVHPADAIHPVDLFDPVDVLRMLHAAVQLGRPECGGHCNSPLGAGTSSTLATSEAFDVQVDLHFQQTIGRQSLVNGLTSH